MRPFTKKNLPYTKELYYLIDGGENVLNDFEFQNIQRLNHILNDNDFNAAYKQLINLTISDESVGRMLPYQEIINLFKRLKSKGSIEVNDDVKISVKHFDLHVQDSDGADQKKGKFPSLGLKDSGELRNLLERVEPSPNAIFQSLTNQFDIREVPEIAVDEEDDELILFENRIVKNISLLMTLKVLFEQAKIRASYENIFLFKRLGQDGRSEIQLRNIPYGLSKNNNPKMPDVPSRRILKYCNTAIFDRDGLITSWDYQTNSLLRPAEADDNPEKVVEAPEYYCIPFLEARKKVAKYIDKIYTKPIRASNLDEFKGEAILDFLDYHHKDGAERGYRKSKYALVEAQGLYCGFCESPLNDGNNGDIEHKLPKSVFPTESQHWENFVLACKTCNQTHKSSRFSIDRGKQHELRTYEVNNLVLPLTWDAAKLRTKFSTHANKYSVIKSSPGYRDFPFSKNSAIYFAIRSAAEEINKRTDNNPKLKIETAFASAYLSFLVGGNYNFEHLLANRESLKESYNEHLREFDIPDNKGAIDRINGESDEAYKDRALTEYRNYYTSLHRFFAEAFLLIGYTVDKVSDKIEQTPDISTMWNNANLPQGFVYTTNSTNQNITFRVGKKRNKYSLSKVILNEKAIALDFVNNLSQQLDINEGYLRVMNRAIDQVTWPDYAIKDIHGNKVESTFNSFHLSHFIDEINVMHEFVMNVSINLNGYETVFLQSTNQRSAEFGLNGKKNQDQLTESGHKFENLSAICELNNAAKKSYWIDQRIIRRAKAWCHAINQLRILKSFDQEISKLSDYYFEQHHPSFITYGIYREENHFSTLISQLVEKNGFKIVLDEFKSGSISFHAPIEFNAGFIEAKSGHYHKVMIEFEEFEDDTEYEWEMVAIFEKDYVNCSIRIPGKSIYILCYAPYKVKDGLLTEIYATEQSLIHRKDTQEFWDWEVNRYKVYSSILSKESLHYSFTWQNILNMIKDGGFYSTWIKTFESYCRKQDSGIEKRYDIELVRQLEISAQSHRQDPFQFHGTDAAEIIELLQETA